MKLVPKHIAIIPDGNRRCAMRLMKKPWKGHEWGIGKIKEVFEWCKELGIKTITFYALSLENLDKRPEQELNFLFALAKKEIDDILTDENNFVNVNKIKMNFFGKIERLPENLQESIKKAMEATENYNDFKINLAIAYGGRQEIVDASRKIGYAIASNRLRPEDVNEMILRHNLSTNGDPDPDLVIRTGKEKRLSNFLLFQSAYSEFVFLDSFWPELKKEEFFRIIEDFSNRDRRFGK